MDVTWEDKLNELLEQFDTSIDDLLRPPLSWQEITTFISVAIMLAEEIFPSPGSGKDKLQLVMEIWDYYDSKYRLIDTMDNLVDFRQIFGVLIGSIVEKFDSTVIRALIEKLVIPILVSKLFPH